MTEVELYNDFAEAANLNKNDWPWVTQRLPGQSYANCFLVSAKGHEWWTPYIGVEFMARLRFRKRFNGEGNELYEVEPVRLTNNKVFRGRSISADCIILI